MTNRVVAIVQARMGSTRLPGKSMMDLAGAPLVGRVLERIKKARLVDEIVLAIPDTNENTVLIDLGHAYGVKVFTGSEDDLVDRYYQSAKSFDADYIVRIPADNPLPHGSEIDRIVSHHIALQRPGFSSNLAQVFGSGYPDGIGAEIFDLQLLEEVWEKETNKEKREHVHLNFFNYSTQQPIDANWCPISTVPCPKNFARPDIILDVNTIEQYDYMSRLYRDLYPSNPNFEIMEIIDWHDNHNSKTQIGV